MNVAPINNTNGTTFTNIVIKLEFSGLVLVITSNSLLSAYDNILSNTDSDKGTFTLNVSFSL